MKILLVALGIYHAKGGIERFNQRVLKVLSKLVATDLVEKVTVISLWDHQKELAQHFPNLNILGFSRNKIRTIWAFIREILSEHYDRILFAHIILVPLLVICTLISRKSRRMLFVYGREVWDKPFWLRGFLTSYLVQEIIGISDFTIKKMAEVYNVDKEKFHLLYPVIDIREPIGQDPVNPSSPREQLLSVSRLSTSSRHKNIDKVIIALPAVLKNFPNARYTIVGEGDWKPELEALSESLGLSEKITFTGGVTEEDLKKQYQAADLFVLPSTGEGFGIVYLEAWQYHLPVIASKYGAAPEVVRDGLDGTCVVPTPAEIASSITELLTNRDRAREMGESGYLRMKTHFTHEKFEARLSEILLDQVKP